MSNQVNTQLYEQASELIDYWTGTQYAERIEDALNRDDTDELYELVRTAHLEMLRQEYEPNEEEIK